MIVDLRALGQAAWKHRRRLLGLHAAVALVAVTTVLLLPRWYVSSVTLVPAPAEGLSLDLTGVGGGLGGAFSLGGAPSAQDQLKMVVSSRAVADSLVRRFGLVTLWKLKRRDQARERLAEHTTVTTPKEGSVVIAAEARTPAQARDLATAYAHFAASEAVRLKTSLASQRRLYLEARLAELEREIQGASQRLRLFEERNGAVALPEQTKETMNAAGALQAQVVLLQTELAGLRRYFTDESNEVALLQDQIVELRRQMERIAKQGGTMLIKGAELPALKQEYMRLNREQMSLTAVSELLRRLYEQARVEEAYPVPSFSILDAADLPERPARPKRGLTVVLAMALASVASVGYLQWGEMRTRAALALAGGEPPVDSGSASEERKAA